PPDTIMTSTDTSVTDKLTTLCDSHAELRAMMQDLLARFNSTPTASTSLFTTTPMPAPTLPGPTFVPPIPGVGLNGASSAAFLSLRTHFPDVDSAVIVAIISHEFKAMDLHKLDPTNCDRDVAYTFNGSTNQFEVSNRAAKEYKTPFSIIIPLQMYFDILAFHVNNASATSLFFCYTTHLVKLIAEYEWTAMYDYHTVFFNCRRAEMAAGDFSQWGKWDNDLLSEHVYAYQKSAPSKPAKAKAVSNPNEACRKYNDGCCTTTPCSWGWPHTCTTCGKTDHGKHQHKD
ncbi:hypothetical protein C0993_005336, partial [Termitomyces sp. T159_Od127]